jgi:hypothetical protein
MPLLMPPPPIPLSPPDARALGVAARIAAHATAPARVRSFMETRPVMHSSLILGLPI